MNPRTLTYILALVFLGMGVILVSNSLNLFGTPTLDKYISPYDVRGMAVVHEGSAYTLNFVQQNSCLDMLNRALPIGKIEQHPKKPNFEKLVIYRFGKPDIELLPIDIADSTLVFKATEWNPTGYLTEVSRGDMWKLLSNAYGH